MFDWFALKNTVPINPFYPLEMAHFIANLKVDGPDGSYTLSPEIGATETLEMSPGTKETMASLRHLYPIRDQESEQIICWGLFLQFENMQGDSTMLPSGGFSMSHELFNT